MSTRVFRSIDEPIRRGLTTAKLWEGPDKGLIWCWERGRQKRVEEPELAARAEKGQLVILAWRGGVEEKRKVEKKSGTLNYLATWQGLRGENLDIDRNDERVIVCCTTGQTVVFSSNFQPDEG